MVNFLKRIFAKSNQEAFKVGSGSQQSLDPQLLLKFGGKLFYRSLRPEEKLPIYGAIYCSNPLARGGVETIVKMTNSIMVPDSGDPQTDEKMREIYRSVNGHEVNAMLIRSSLIWGFAVGELVWNNQTLEIEKIVVPQSPTIRFVSTNHGDITHIRQLISLQPTIIPASKFIICQRDKTDSFDLYGSSLFESCIDQFESLCQILDAQLKVYMRLGKPRFQISIPSEGLTMEEFQDHLNKTQSVFSNLSEGSDIYMPTGVEVKIIGAESFGQKFESETRLLVSTILSNVGLPPALLNVNIQSAGTESYARQSILCLMTQLSTMQDSIAESWNSSFWPLAQKLYGLKTKPRMCFERPRLLEQEQEEKAREATRINDWWEVIRGRDIEWFVQRLGATPDQFDMEVLQKQIAKDREANIQETIGSPNTNKKASTKITDANQSSDTSS